MQMAINPADGEMVIIEMNPRVSRSSALASKATGAPARRPARLHSPAWPGWPGGLLARWPAPAGRRPMAEPPAGPWARWPPPSFSRGPASHPLPSCPC